MASPGRSPCAAEEAFASVPAVTEVDKSLASPPEKVNGPDVKSNGDYPNGGGAGSSGQEEGDGEATLERAIELFDKGSRAIEDGDFVESVDCLSRALEIRVAHYGELASECASFYYKYGYALLFKAQEEADPLGDVPKDSSRSSTKSAAAAKIEDGGSLKTSNSIKHDSSSITGEVEGASEAKDEDDGNDGSEGEDEELGDADEDESDLDLSWKMLDIARAIVEKNPDDSIEKVNIFSALGEVSLEREDIETSLSDYHRALAILERLVEPDNRRIIELNFRICLVLEVGSKVEEATQYCEKAISLCKSQLNQLREALANSENIEETEEKPMSDNDTGVPKSVGSCSEPSKLEREIEVLSGILTELEKKLEDLQQLLSNPKSIVTELLKQKFATLPSSEKGSPQDLARSLSINSSQMAVVEGSFDSPTVSTAANSGITHLGVVGRGVKRATVAPSGSEPSPKKSVSDLSAENANSSVAESLPNAQNSEPSPKKSVSDLSAEKACSSAAESHTNAENFEPSPKKSVSDLSADKDDSSVAASLPTAVNSEASTT